MAREKFLRAKKMLGEVKRHRREVEKLPPQPSLPKTRGDCLSMPRPCPFVSCRHHLFLDVTDNGSISMSFGSDVNALEAMDETCALDVADKGGRNTLDRLADLYHVRLETIRKVEIRALEKMKSYCEGGRLHAQGAPDTSKKAEQAALTTQKKPCIVKRQPCEISDTLRAIGLRAGERAWVKKTLLPWIRQDKQR